MRAVLLSLVLLPSLALAQDADGDGILDANDNCVSVSNNDQADVNADGYGDACIAPTAAIGAGVTIANGALVGQGASIGDGSSLASTTEVQSAATVGPHVVLLGDTTIATRAVLGGATVAPPGGTAVTVGAGTVVSRRAQVGVDATIGSDNVYGRSVSIGDRLTAFDDVSVGFGTTLGDDATLGDGSTLGSLVTLGDGADVGAGAVLGRGMSAGAAFRIGSGAIVGPGTQMGDDVEIGANVRLRKDVVLGSNVVIESGVRIGRGVELQDGVTVGSGARLDAGTVVLAGGDVPDGATVGRGVTYTGIVEDCTDGIDNNTNGFLDCEEAGCASHPSCDESLNCSDTLDNDEDGDFDCDDFDCIADPACATPSGVDFHVTIQTGRVKAQDGNFSRYTTSVQGSSCGASTYVGNIVNDRRYIIDAEEVSGTLQVDPGGTQSMDCTFQVGQAKFIGQGLGNPLFLRSRTGFQVNCTGPGNNPDVYGTDWLPKRMNWAAGSYAADFQPTNSFGELWYVPEATSNYGSVFESGYGASSGQLYLGPDCTIGVGSMNYQYFSGFGWPTVSSSPAIPVAAPDNQVFQFPR